VATNSIFAVELPFTHARSGTIRHAREPIDYANRGETRRSPPADWSGTQRR